MPPPTRSSTFVFCLPSPTILHAVGSSNCKTRERDTDGTTSVKVENSRGALSKLLKRYRRDPSLCAKTRVSFSNDVCTPLRAHPDLMNTTSIHVDPIAHAVCLLFGIFLFRIGNRKLTFDDQMGGQALVGVRAVVGVPVAKSVSPVSRQ